MIRAAVAAAAAVTLVTSGSATAAPTISMSGSSVAQALLADLAYFYRHTLDVPPRFSFVTGGTQTGINDAARRIVDAGMVSRELTAGERTQLVLTPVARSGVCLVTNRANPVPGLTRAQVQDIIAGRVTNWAQVPGSPRTDAIVPVGLNPTAGARLVFDSVFVDLATPIVYTPRTYATSAEVRDFVERTPGAWGYVDLALAGRLHPLTYENVDCSRATIRSGAYPAARPLGVVTRGRPRGPLARFLDWIKKSPVARRVIASRYVPITS
jgi:phosphate transport system substrate-binding protein